MMISERQRLHIQKLADARRGYKFPEDVRRHMGKRKITDEYRKRMSQKMTGENNPMYGVRITGRIMSQETRRKISAALKGRIISISQRRKISESLKKERSHLWRGGITKVNREIRNSVHYKIWREKVFKRDNYTCACCGKRGGDIQADHIKSFSRYPKSRFSLKNGRTLCILCHRNTPNFGNKDRIYTQTLRDRVSDMR